MAEEMDWYCEELFKENDLDVRQTRIGANGGGL